MLRARFRIERNVVPVFLSIFVPRYEVNEKAISRYLEVTGVPHGLTTITIYVHLP